MPGGSIPSESRALEDLLVLISGGGGALGIAICQELIGLGARVVVADIGPPPAEWADAALAPRHEVCDVADESAVASLLARLTSEMKLPDVVCCHAGVVHDHPILDYPVEEFDQLLRANLRGAFVLAQQASRLWIENNAPGHLIFTASWVAGVPWPGIAPYAASKAAVVSLMKSFAAELAPAGIRANAISPGIVSGGMARRQWETNPEYRQRAERVIALGALQDPASVARAFALMCGPDFAYSTGSVLTIDGGCSLSMLG